MGQIFISYSRRDTEIVDRIAGQMKDAGLDVWIDREAIQAGDTWRVQIVQAIDTCLAFVLMLSPNSAASDNVRREIDLAQDVESPFLPLMLEPVKIPPEIRYQLAGQQFIDVQMLGFEKAVRQLIETIKEHLKNIQPAVEAAARQVELVIQGIGLKDLTTEKQEQLLDFLAQLSNSDRSQLEIANLASGSVHVFVDMPARSAYELKTLALNRDKRFKQFDIVSLRLDGNTRYVNTSLGILTQTATLGLLQAIWLRVPPLLRSIFGLTAGKFLTVLLTVLVLAGVALAAAQSLDLPFAPPTPTATSTPAPTATQPPEPTFTLTAEPTETLTLSPTGIPTSTPTPTPTSTATATPVPTYQILRGTVQVEETLSCRYGPGADYLNQDAYINGLPITITGRNDKGDWLYGLGLGYRKPCWVNARFVKLSGDANSLEPVYPDKVALPLYVDPKFPPPTDVEAVRKGDQVSVYWVGYELALGDREGANSPRYLVEAWTCQGGEIVFTPVGTFVESALIKDEAGCSEPSHGRLFLVHRDGYVGPVEIPWPAYSTP